MKKKKKPVIGILTALFGLSALLIVLSLKGCVLGLNEEENKTTPTPLPTPEVTYINDGTGILLSLATYRFPETSPDASVTPTLLVEGTTPTPNEPTKEPTVVPTVPATITPNGTPDLTPSIPTKEPTAVPTKAPTTAPTKVPTKAPTKEPVKTPTPIPTKAPTNTPAPTATPVPTPVPTNTPTPKPMQYASDPISVEINKQREANGIAKLGTTDIMTSLAQKRLQEVIAAGGFDSLFSEETYEHFRPDGRPWYTLFEDAGISYFKRAEIFAYYKSNPTQTVASLMNNSNRSYLMNDSYQEMGVAYNDEYVVILLKR